MRFPFNTIPTGLARAKIAHNGSPSDYATGEFMAITFPNPDVPLYRTVGTALSFPAGSVPDVFGTSSVSMSPGTNSAPWIGFLKMGADYLLAPAREESILAPSIYRLTYGGGASNLTVRMNPPQHVFFNYWTRNGGVWTKLQLQFRPGPSEATTVALPAAITAIYFEVERNAAGNNRDSCEASIDVTIIPAGTTTLSVGNHCQVLIAVPTPGLADYKMKRAKCLGLRSMWSFRDSEAYASGNICVSQFPPGVFHSEFSGATVFDQIQSARMPHSYFGHVKDGASICFAPANVDTLAIAAEEQTIHNSGYVVYWTDASVNMGAGATAAKFLFQLWFTIEFTSSSSAQTMTLPDYATLDDLYTAFYLLSRMPLASENPLHQKIDQAWQWFKRNAVKVLTNPQSYYTLGDVVGAAMLL